MLAESVGIFRLDVSSLAVLADGGFNGYGAVGVDGVTDAAEEGTGDAAVRGEEVGVAGGGDVLAGVASDEGPLTLLTLELKNVEEELVGSPAG